MIFSLILATYGREQEVANFFDSLVKQTLAHDEFEVIVVDQNEAPGLSQIVQQYRDKLNIVHLISSKKGLSLNRNIGISISKGNYICFPDDDCLYYPNTLEAALRHLESSNSPLVFGAIRDRATGENLIKNWPLSSTLVTRWTIQRFATSISFFMENNKLTFCEDLGAGTWNGSCEDLDYLYRAVCLFGPSPYYPDLEVWHPSPAIGEIDPSKVASYGRGFGSFCRRNVPSVPILTLFVMSLIYHFGCFVIELFKFNIPAAKNRFIAFRSRLISFFRR